MNTRSATLRNTGFATVAVYTEYFLGMLTSILIARDLGPADFGTYGLVLWFIAVGMTAANSGTAGGVIKFIAELRGAGTPELIAPLLAYLRRAQRIFLAVVLVIGTVVFFTAGDHLLPGFDHGVLFAILAISTALRANYMLNLGVAKGFEHFRATALIAMIVTPINLLMVLVGFLLQAPVEGFLAVYMVSSAVFYFVSARQAAALIPPSAPTTVLPEALRARVLRHMRITSAIVTVTYLTASEVEVMLLNLFGAPEAAGIFKVAYQIADGATLLVPGVFGVLLLPMMAKALSESADMANRRFAGATVYLAMLATPLLAFGVLFAQPIMAVLYGPAYLAAGGAFAAILVGKSMAVMSQGGSSLLMSADRQHTVLWVALACGALKVVLGVLLVREHALAGAVVSYAIATSVTACVYVAAAMYASGARLPWGRLVRVFLAGGLAAACAAPLHWAGHPLVTAAAGAVLVISIYAPATLVFGCWTVGDIEYLKSLHQRVARSRPAAAARLLDWAGRRAAQEAT
jgi:O-antigen/teichoic acid export membrane protein